MSMDEQDRHEQERQYRRMESIYDHGERITLLSIYEKEFEKRYKVKPIYPIKGSQFTAMDGLIEMAKEANALLEEIIKTFFKKDDYFPKGHGLESLRKNFSLVHSELAKSKPKEPRASHRYIQSHQSCRMCGHSFLCMIDLNAIEQRTDFICPECQSA